MASIYEELRFDGCAEDHSTIRNRHVTGLKVKEIEFKFDTKTNDLFSFTP